MKLTAAYLLSFCLFFYILGANAQTQTAGTKLTGLLAEKSGLPFQAILNLTKANDSTFKKTITVSDSGSYAFDHLSPGPYVIEIKALGFQSIIFPFEIRDTEPLLKHDFVLVQEAQNLEAVSIVGKKRLIERYSDKTVVNVENSIAIGNSALEILARIPGLSVNQDGTISIKGKSGVNVLIDGKSTYLSAAQLAARLRSLNSNTIKSIEVVTSPTAKYDAAGNAGIIDIKLKKNANYGTNGNLDFGVGYSRHAQSNAGLSLNHRTANLNVFGNFANSNSKLFEDLDIKRINDNNGEKTYFYQQNFQVRSSHDNNYKVGLDYFINPKNTIGILASGYFNNGHDSSVGNTFIGKSFTQIDSLVKANNPSKNNANSQAYNLNYKSAFDTLGKELSVDLDYAKYRSDAPTTYYNDFYNADGTVRKAPSVFRNATPSIVKIWAAKADYTHPFNDKTKLALGIKTSKVSTDNDFRFENLLNNNWQNDVGRSNRFNYKENINAAYATLSHDFGSTSLEVGLRAEQTNSTANAVNDQKTVKRSYLDFFPNIAVTQSLAERHKLSFAYNRRIDRPDYKSLNPFVYFVDLYTFSQGNPFLNAQYTNALSLTYNYDEKLNVSLGYSLTKNLITDVFLANETQKTLYVTTQNLGRQYAYDLTLSAPTTIAKFWSMDNSLTTTYNQTQTDNLNGFAYNKKKLNFTFNSSHSFTLSTTTTAELSGDYTSAQIYGTYAIKPYYGIDLGLKKSFLDNKFSLKFAVNDVLNTRKARVNSAVANLAYSLSQKQETNIFRLSFNYAFGNSKVKSARERQTGAAAEEGRIK